VNSMNIIIGEKTIPMDNQNQNQNQNKEQNDGFKNMKNKNTFSKPNFDNFDKGVQLKSTDDDSKLTTNVLGFDRLKMRKGQPVIWPIKTTSSPPTVPPKSERKKIIIDKHFHLDHEKAFPEDLEHEEGVTQEMQPGKIKENDHNKTHSEHGHHHHHHHEHPQEPVNPQEPETFPQNIVTTHTDQNKKVQVNINIPNSNPDSKTKNTVTVYNHYFINDKSMTMNQPKNPNVINLFGEGKTPSPIINTIKNPKFISDDNFKEYNNTMVIDNNSVNYVVERKEDQAFYLPNSQKSKLKRRNCRDK